MRNILDAGSGDGIVATSLIQENQEVNLVCYDMSQVALSNISNSRITSICGSIGSLPFTDNAFDFSWSMDVFEHLRPDEVRTSLSELLRVSRHGVLIITPASESDAIIVQCPKCSTVFNPYHHINYFDQNTWFELLDKNLPASFYPIGKVKPDIPKGFRTAFLQDELFVYTSNTQCPLCDTRFNTSCDSNLSMNGAISKRIKSRKPCFGVRYEELGIFIPKNSLPSNNTDKSSTIKLYSNTPIRPVLTSCNNVDFLCDSQLVEGFSILDEGGKYITSADVVTHSANSNDTEVTNVIVALSLVGDSNSFSLDLDYIDESSGVFTASIFDSMSGNYRDIASADCHGVGVKKTLTLEFEINENHITPYGVLLKIAGGSVGSSAICQLQQLRDNKNRDKVYKYSPEQQAVTIDTNNLKAGMRLELEVLKLRPETIRISGHQGSYDLSHLIPDSPHINKKFIVPVSLLTDISGNAFNYQDQNLEGFVKDPEETALEVRVNELLGRLNSLQDLLNLTETARVQAENRATEMEAHYTELQDRFNILSSKSNRIKHILVKLSSLVKKGSSSS